VGEPLGRSGAGQGVARGEDSKGWALVASCAGSEGGNGERSRARLDACQVDGKEGAGGRQDTRPVEAGDGRRSMVDGSKGRKGGPVGGGLVVWARPDEQ
jgi:hypothetical protein